MSERPLGCEPSWSLDIPSDRPVSHLIVNRLISGRMLVQSDFSMGHLKRLYIDTAREAGVF